MSKNWAIVIGINQYNPNNFAPLKYAKRDAELMRDFFRQAQFDEVCFFTDDSPDFKLPNGTIIQTRPTLGNLRSFLHDRFDTKPFLSTGDNCWFFFAGHGGQQNNRDYLMPQDANPRDLDYTAIPVSYVRERLIRSGADNVILILDACRTDGGRSSSVGNEPQQGVITISACSPTQKSWEIDELQHGAFTYALHEALQIPGERNCATVERLDQYLRYRVPDLCQQYRKFPEQTPRIAVDPIEKSHFILLPQYMGSIDLLRVDLLTLKNDAYRATSNRHFALAEQIWRRILTINGSDSEAINALQNIAVMKAEQPRASATKSTQQSEGVSSRNAKAQSVQPQFSEADLVSEKGISYIRLYEYLGRGDWNQADRETSNVMRQITDRTADRWLRSNDIATLSKTDLSKINQLWIEFSKNKFGFSIQKQIWKAHGSPASYGDVWEKFGKTVGWYKDGEWSRYHYTMKDPPFGHFPREFAFTTSSGGTARGREDLPISLTVKLLKRAF